MVGCNRDSSGPDFRTRNPRPGTVKVLATKLAETPDKQRWQWYIMGDRNWTKPVAAPDGRIELSDAYPLNEVNNREGTFTWYVELVVTRRPADNKVVWETILHGTNGVTVKASGYASGASSESGSLANIRQKTDTNPNMPTEIELARINGGPTIRLRLRDK